MGLDASLFPEERCLWNIMKKRYFCVFSSTVLLMQSDSTETSWFISDTGDRIEDNWVSWGRESEDTSNPELEKLVKINL